MSASGTSLTRKRSPVQIHEAPRGRHDAAAKRTVLRIPYVDAPAERGNLGDFCQPGGPDGEGQARGQARNVAWHLSVAS